MDTRLRARLRRAGEWTRILRRRPPRPTPINSTTDCTASAKRFGVRRLSAAFSLARFSQIQIFESGKKKMRKGKERLKLAHLPTRSLLPSQLYLLSRKSHFLGSGFPDSKTIRVIRGCLKPLLAFGSSCPSWCCSVRCPQRSVPA
jgi:hypothetical protein